MPLFLETPKSSIPISHSFLEIGKADTGDRGDSTPVRRYLPGGWKAIWSEERRPSIEVESGCRRVRLRLPRATLSPDWQERRRDQRLEGDETKHDRIGKCTWMSQEVQWLGSMGYFTYL